MAKIIYPANRKDWLKYKESTIGGSEIASICGLNPYQTPRDIWELKTGRDSYIEPNWAMRLGVHFEQGVVELWEEESGNRAIKCSSKDILYVHPLFDFLTGTPDRRYFDKDGGKGLLEIKTTAGIFDYDEIPPMWAVQLQWYLGITGYEKGTLAWFEYRSRELKMIEYDFDPELFKQLVDIAVDFHRDNILGDKEPEAINSNDVEKMFNREEPGKIIEASEDVQEAYSRIKNIQFEILPLKKEMDTIKEQIKMGMRDAEKVKYMDQVLFTWKADKKGSRRFIVK